MSLKFQDIMKNFYNDETLGIKNEDAPVNATGTSVAGTGDDASTVVVKKKKKKLYDGRTKDAKSFIKRMETLRAKRESKLAKKVQENTDNFGVEYLLAEDNIAILKNIVKNKQNNKIKMKDGTMRIDLFTASALTQALDQVKPDTKKKMMDIINKGGKSQLMKLVSVVMK
jgi:sucrose-6-phosphate hydrolase SacC (GH32 family)